MKTINEIENEINILGECYNIMTVGQKVQYLNLLCNYRTAKGVKEIIVFFNTQILKEGDVL